jgi:hypothetical protein
MKSKKINVWICCLFLVYNLIRFELGRRFRSRFVPPYFNSSFKFDDFYTNDFDVFNFENFDNQNGSVDLVVPNKCHLMYFNKTEFKFVNALNIYSLFVYQNCEKILIHCDFCDFKGEHWNQVRSTDLLQDLIDVRVVQRKSKIYGVEYQNVEDYSDYYRLVVLAQYGGIYIDSDVIILTSLDTYRKYEMVLSVEDSDKTISSNSLMTANRYSRFLNAYIESFR